MTVASEIDVAAEADFGWRRLQWFATFATLASLAGPMLIELKLEPFLLSMAAPFVVGVILMLRWPRAAALWLGASCLFALLPGVPFLLDALTHPESMRDFIPLSVFTTSTVVGAIAAVPSFREASRGSSSGGTARLIALAAGGVTVAAGVVSVVMSVGVASDTSRGGDIVMTARDLRFSEKLIESDASVAVYINNNDTTRHTFTIDALGVDLEVPPKTGQRVAFDAAPGTYTFYCRPHEADMHGMLVVR